MNTNETAATATARMDEAQRQMDIADAAHNDSLYNEWFAVWMDAFRAVQAAK